MKKIICLLLTVCIVLSLAACFNKKKPVTNPTDNSAGNNQQSSSNTNESDNPETMVAVSVPAVTENVTAEDGAVIFQYTYQHISLVLHKPEIADKVIIDFLNRIDQTKASADATAKIAQAAYTGSDKWVPYLYHIVYSPMRIDHNVLSFLGNNVVYTGAGHPERTCVSASYDLMTGDVLTLASIMTKEAKLEDFCNLVLDELKEMAKSNYLYENYTETVKKRFEVDASQDEAWYFSQNGLCFYFVPYEIAPYSSGVVSVEIPYSKLKGLLHSDYFPTQRKESTGVVSVSAFENVNIKNFKHIAEVIENNKGKMLMAHTDGVVQDVRITLNSLAGSYTVFAAYNLIPGDGIMVQAEEATLKKMELTYKSGKNTIKAPIFQ